MIAPIREPEAETSESRRRMLRAYRLLASTLLPEKGSAPAPAPIPAWRAWLAVGWAAIVAGFYVASMLGLW